MAGLQRQASRGLAGGLARQGSALYLPALQLSPQQPVSHHKLVAAAVRSLERLTYLLVSGGAGGGVGGSAAAAASPGNAGSPGGTNQYTAFGGPAAVAADMNAASPRPTGGTSMDVDTPPAAAASSPGPAPPLGYAATAGPALQPPPGGDAAMSVGDLPYAVRRLRPWQQRTLALAVCRHINSVLAAAHLPAVPFGAAAQPLPFPAAYVRACSAAALSRPADVPTAPPPGTFAGSAGNPGSPGPPPDGQPRPSAVRHGDIWLMRWVATGESGSGLAVSGGPCWF